MQPNATDHQEVKTRTLTLVMRDDGILHGTSLPDSQQSIEDARGNLECMRALTGGRPVRYLLDIRNTGSLSREARKLYAGDEGARAVAALAFVVDSAFTRVTGNLFARLAKTNYPVRLFASADEAIRWLHECE